MSGIERRRSPRADVSVPIKISGGEFDIVTDSKNLSASGAYCTIAQYLEPMTKLKVQLLLPFKKNGKAVTKKVTCSGVVVRTQARAGEQDFDTAIYFNEIDEKSKNAIADYVFALLYSNPAQNIN